MRRAATARPIETLIRQIRGQKSSVDADLAEPYEVPTGALNQAVRLNIEQLPKDFALRLSKAEFERGRLAGDEIERRHDALASAASFAPQRFGNLA